MMSVKLRSPLLYGALIAVAATTVACDPAESELELELELDETDDVSLRAVEFEDLDPVMVTSGTCESHGYRTMESHDECPYRLSDELIFRLNDIEPSEDELQALLSEYSPGCRLKAVRKLFDFSDNPRLMVQRSFSAWTPEDLEAGECSHDVPCICADDMEPEPEPALGGSACKDGVFQPDPDKYYTIMSPQRRYMRLAASADLDFAYNDVILTPNESDPLNQYVRSEQFDGPDQPFDSKSDPSDILFNWRFVPHEDGGYFVVNRRAGGGRPLSVSDGAKLALRSDAVPINFTCEGKRVVMEQNGMFPVDVSARVPDHPHDHAASGPYVYTSESEDTGFFTRRSNCMANSNTCSSRYGSEWVQIGHRKCNPWSQERVCRYTPNRPPLSAKLRQVWYVEELTNRMRALNFDPEPIPEPSVTAPGPAADSMATHAQTVVGPLGAEAVTALADSAKLAGPLYGAIFTIGVNTAFKFGAQSGNAFFEQPDPLAELAQTMEDVLDELIDGLQGWTAALVDNQDAKAAASVLDNVMDARMDHFLNPERYPELRHAAIFGTKDPAVEGDNLSEKADQFGFEIAAAFSAPEDDESDFYLELLKTHFAMDVAKLAWTAALYMSAEGALMQAYGNPEQTCEDAVLELEDLAADATESLEDGQDALLAWGQDNEFDRQLMDPSEFEFDVTHFSYPIERQLEFFETIVEETVAKCYRLRDPEDSFRYHFEHNTLPPPPPGELEE